MAKTTEKETKVVPQMIVESKAGKVVVLTFDKAWSTMREQGSLGNCPVRTRFVKWVHA